MWSVECSHLNGFCGEPTVTGNYDLLPDDDDKDDYYNDL